MFHHRIQILILCLCISGSTNSLSAPFAIGLLKLKPEIMSLDIFANIGATDQNKKALLYSQVLSEKFDQNGFYAINSGQQITFIQPRKQLLSGMGEDDPPKKPNLRRECESQLESMSFEDLLNFVLWLLVQINSGNIQAQDCVVELLNLLSTQISSGQIGDSRFRELFSQFINLIYQNSLLFELVREWFDD